MICKLKNKHKYKSDIGQQLIMHITLICFVVGVFSSGCTTTKNAMRRRYAMDHRSSGIMKPYVAEKMFNAQPDFVFELVISHLNSQGAWVLCRDKKAGVVCWCSTGADFVPLPDKDDRSRMHGLEQVNASFWRGFVYGCAHIVASGGDAWFTVRSLGRDANSGRRVFSDGSYEGKIISSLKHTLHLITTGQRRAPEFLETEARNSRGAAVNYDDLFKAKFRNFPKINSNDIVAKIQGESYPVSADRLWSACLDVVTQYALVPFLNSDERIIIFSRKLPVPASVETKKLKHVDVIMAVTIQPDTEDPESSCRMYASLLDEDDLVPRAVEQKSSENQEETEVDLSGPLIDTAAIISVNEMAEQIDTQLYYNEKLGTKLLRRLSE